jgi:hypothetical protein
MDNESLFSDFLKGRTMKSKSTGELPVSSGLQGIQVLAALVTLLMAGLSVIGLVLSDRLYPTEELIQSFMTNDLINLLIGAPTIFAALVFIWKRKTIGLLLLPGSMLYVIYNSIAYVVGRPYDLYATGHLILILACGFVIYTIFARLDSQIVEARLGGAVPAKFSGWVLTGFGAFFSTRAVGVFANSLIKGTAIPVSEVGVLAADMVLSILLIAGGVMLLRNRAIGMAAGLGLLYAVSMLFIGLIVLMGVQAALIKTAFPFVDILVVALIGSVCFIPFVKYLRASSKLN